MTDTPADPAGPTGDVPEGWELRATGLHRTLTFADFAEAWAFMEQVAALAEELDHHPDWANSWNEVRIDLLSHDVGAVTGRDRQFAARINILLAASEGA